MRKRWLRESVLFSEDQRWEVGNRWPFTKNAAVAYLRWLGAGRNGKHAKSRIRILRLSNWILGKLGDIARSCGSYKLLRFKLNLLILESAKLLSAGFGIKGFKNYSRRVFSSHYESHENSEGQSGALLVRVGLLLVRAYRLILSIGRTELVGVGSGASTLLKFSKFFYRKLVDWWKVVLDIGILEGLVSVDERRGWLRYYWTLTDTKERLSRLPLWVRAYGVSHYSWQYLKKRPYPVSSLADCNDFFFWRNRFRYRSELGFDWLSRLKKITSQLYSTKFLSLRRGFSYFTLNCRTSVYDNSLGCGALGLLVPVLRTKLFGWLVALFTYNGVRTPLVSYLRLTNLLYLMLYKQLCVGLRVSLFSMGGWRSNYLGFKN